MIGLGDTLTTSEGNFRIGDKTLRAERDTWVAFHPDKPHEVTKLKKGYRAVLVFKIIRVDNEPDVFPAQLEDNGICSFKEQHTLASSYAAGRYQVYW